MSAQLTNKDSDFLSSWPSTSASFRAFASSSSTSSLSLSQSSSESKTPPRSSGLPPRPRSCSGGSISSCKSNSSSLSASARSRSSSCSSLKKSRTVQDLTKACKETQKSISNEHDDDREFTESEGSHYNELGNNLFRQGQYAAAKEAYKQAVAYSPVGEQLTAAYSNLATVLWREGDIQEAIQYLKRALKVDELETLLAGRSLYDSPMAASIYHQLGLCSALLNKFKKSIKYLTKAKEIRAFLFGKRDLSVGQTEDAIGKIYWMMGDMELALKYHKSALKYLSKAGVNTIPTLQSIANAHIAAGQFDLAIAVLNKVYRKQKLDLLSIPELAVRQPTQESEYTAMVALSQTLQVLEGLYLRVNQPEHAAACHQEMASMSYACMPHVQVQSSVSPLPLER